MRVFTLMLVLVAATAARAEDAVPVFEKGWQEPQVAISPQHGVFVVAARDGVIEVASSSDTRAFSKPARVATVENLMCGMRRGPRIAASEHALVVTAISAASGDLLAWRSTDEAATWTGPTRVNGAEHSAREGLDGLAADGKDDFAVVWLDDRKGGKEVWAATSSDAGATWREKLVYASPDGHVCECCHPSAAFGPHGELAVMWRNWLEGNRDFYWALSKDLGGTWSKGQKLGQGSWRVNMCPMDGGAIVGGANGFATVWRRESEIYAAMPGKPERRIASGKQCWIAQTKGGLHAVWLEGSDLVAMSGKEKRPIASGAKDPCVAGSLEGDGPVVVVWQAEDGVFAKTLVAPGRSSSR